MLIWVERRLLGFWQERLGPNRVGWFGIMQVVADMIKIFTKEDWVPPFADKLTFVLAPAIIMIVVLMSFAVIPFTPEVGVIDSNVGVLFVLAMASLGALQRHARRPLVEQQVRLARQLARGGANGQLRSLHGYFPARRGRVVGQLQSARDRRNPGRRLVHRPAMHRLSHFPDRRSRREPPAAVRHSEAEQEICAGYHTEYSGMKFGMFFVGEYLGLVLISSLITVLFFGGWLGPAFLPPIVWFSLKAGIFIAFFILMRAALPRPRYDQLMSYGWLFLLPLSLVNLLITGAVVLGTM